MFFTEETQIHSEAVWICIILYDPLTLTDSYLFSVILGEFIESFLEASSDVEDPILLLLTDLILRLWILLLLDLMDYCLR